MRKLSSVTTITSVYNVWLTWSKLLLRNLQVLVLGVALVSSASIVPGLGVPLLAARQVEPNVHVAVVGDLVVAKLVVWGMEMIKSLDTKPHH